MKRKTYTAEGAVSVGPYSHAVDSGDLVFLSGQTPMDPKTGKIAEGDIGPQTVQCFANLENVLMAAELTMEDVVKVNVFLTEMKNFSLMNEVYATRFAAPYPARSTIGVRELPLGALIEIEMIARRSTVRP